MSCCGHFAKLWHRSQRANPPQLFSVLARCPTEFPRLEIYFRREPPMQTRRPCACGEPDAWKCWSRVRALELYGGGRRDDGVVLMRDREALPVEDEDERRK